MRKFTTTKIILTVFTAVFLNLTLVAQNTITTDSILQLSTCAGGNILIPYKTTGSYPFGTKFIAQLSDFLGQFTIPTDIGQVPLNTGIILGVIPKSANFGFLYKIRVITTNPAVIGSACPNTLIITQVAQLNKIIASPNDTICKGDSVKLTAINLATSYKWSTGDTTQSITVKKGGVYSVTTRDPLTCQSDASITIVVNSCNAGINEKNGISTFAVYPNPAADVININNIKTSSRTAYQIFNALGQLTKEGSIEGNSIKIGELSSGLYFIRISSSENHATGKFLKE